MTSAHIPAIELVTSALIRMLAAYVLFFVLTRLASRASARHALWLVFLGTSAVYWLAVLKQLLNLQSVAGLASSPAVASSFAATQIGSETALRIPLSWSWSVAPAAVFISWMYVLGATVMMLRVVWRRRRLREAISQAQYANSELEKIFDEQCDRLEISNCQILELPGLTSPGTAYLLHPVVVMPEGIGRCVDGEQLIDVVYHELMHVKRLDFLWSTLAEFAACLLFFHPVMWLALRNLARERELACDMAVMELRDGRRQDYALCLTRLARRQVLGFQVEPPKHLALLNSFLAFRVKTLLHERRRRGRFAQVAAAGIGFGVLCLFTASWSSLALAVMLQNAAPRVMAAVPSVVRPSFRRIVAQRHNAPTYSGTDTPQGIEKTPEPNVFADQPEPMRFSPVDPSRDGDTGGDAKSGSLIAPHKWSSRTVGNDQSTSPPSQSAPSWQKSAADAAIGALSRVAAGKRDSDGDSDDRAAKPF
jgi:beta-lactamase regulating signal transducer with metallopeptidase domain